MSFYKKLYIAIPNRTMLLIMLILSLQWLFVVWTSKNQANHKTWTQLISFPMWPPHADLLAITEGWDETIAGRDPLREDQDPPLYNYPRLWLVGAKLGLRSSDAKWLGAIWAMFFLAATCATIAYAPSWTRPIVITITTSPSVWLALERGNSDMLIFALLTPALIANPKPGWRDKLPSLALLLGAMLKLFPAVCFAVNLHNINKKSWQLTAAISLAFILYLATTRQDVQAALHKTAYGSRESYGATIAADKLASYWKSLSNNGFKSTDSISNKNYRENALRLTIIFMIAIACWNRIKRINISSNDFASYPNLPSARLFIAGAMIYISTFLLGTNWAYRLIFLIWTVPYLAQKLNSGNWPERIWSFCSISTICVICWQLASRTNFEAPLGHLLSIILIYPLSREITYLIISKPKQVP
jgi:hypothetical protein